MLIPFGQRQMWALHTQATSPHPDVCYALLSCSSEPRALRGWRWQSWGSSTLLLTLGVMGVSGQPGEPLLSGNLCLHLLPPGVPRWIFLVNQISVEVNGVVFLFVIKCCRSYCWSVCTCLSDQVLFLCFCTLAIQDLNHEKQSSAASVWLHFAEVCCFPMFPSCTLFARCAGSHQLWGALTRHLLFWDELAFCCSSLSFLL